MSDTAVDVRVLHVSGFASVLGGGERHVRDLTRFQPARGMQLAVACPPRGPLWEDAPGLGVARFAADLRTGASPGHLGAIHAAIREFKPHVIHAHGGRAALWSRLADSRARHRVVYTLHGIHVRDGDAGIHGHAHLLAERRLRNRTARFITVCRSDLVKGSGLGVLDPDRTSVVHNGVEARASGASDEFAAPAKPSRVPTVAFVGRLADQKDPLTLLDAWELLVRQIPAARLVMVGDGPLAAAVAGRVVGQSWAGSVELMGARQVSPAFYRDVDLLALPSRWEGFPYVMLEAMAEGVPVVAASVDGIPEAVVDGVNGRLVPPQDPEALSAALLDILTRSDRGAALGATGRDRLAKVFTLESMLTGIDDVYAAVLGGG